MPVSSFRHAVVEQKIELAKYTITMLGRVMAQLERAHRDTTLARRYLHETEAYLSDLRSELQALRGAAAADRPGADEPPRSNKGRCATPELNAKRSLPR